MERQPYFVQLYNLHLSGEIPPTPVEKQALAKVVYWHCNFNPLAPSDGNSYPPTGAISVRNGDSQVALFKITQDNLQYCHPEYPATPYDTSKEPLKDWWQEDYQSFINEYKHLRAFVDGYIEGEIQRTDLEWLDEAIGNITRKLYYFYNAEPKIPLPVGPFFSTIPVGKKFNLKHFTFFTNPKYSALQTPTKKMFSKVYLELTDLIENSQNLRRCEHKDCNNIFYANHQSRKYCFGKICQAKRSAESSKESDNRSRDTIRKRIVRAIDEWLEDKEQIRAAELMDEIPNIAKIMGNQKDLASDPAKSLGTYLSGKLMEKLLRKKGIKLTIKKEGTNLYCFERIAIP